MKDVMGGENMFWTTATLSEVTGLTQRHIARLCKSGAIKAQSVGNMWLIDDEDAKRFVAERTTSESAGQSSE